MFVTGESYGESGSTDYATVAYDVSTGAQLWTSRYNGPTSKHDSAYALAVSPDGAKVFVTGVSPGRPSGPDYATVAYDVSTGVQLWESRYDGPAGRGDSARVLGVSPDGTKLFVSGKSDGGSASGPDYATVAYDASTGTRLWTKRYNGPGNGSDYASALGVSPDGTKVFVTGQSDGGFTISFDYATVAYDASTGVRLWARRYNGPGNRYDFPYALGVTPDGTQVFVTGRSYGGSASYLDYATVAYDASTGTRRWARRYKGPRDARDGAYALVVSADGTTVHVTGTSYRGLASDYDYVTVSYDAPTGAQLWAKRYGGRGSGEDDAKALGVSADGKRVFVTGTSEGERVGDFDYATVAYSTR